MPQEKHSFRLLSIQEMQMMQQLIYLRKKAKKGFPGVIHCFTAGPELAKAALELGFYISLSGIVTFKNAGELRETIKNIPEEY